MATIQTVTQGIINNMHVHAWNPQSATKNPHSGSFTLNTGGLFINYEQLINWSSYNQNWQVNLASPGSSELVAGLTQLNSHDPQVCMTYLRAVVLYKQAFPTDTSFDLPNGLGYMGVSEMVDHLTLLDFAPATNSSNGHYNNPKGWVYFALLDIYLGLQHSNLITNTQKTALQQSTLYQAFTYMNSWLDTTTSIFDNEKHQNYQPSQSLLMAAAVLDASQRWPSSIFTGMFYDSAPFTPQTPAAWASTAVAGANNVLTRGAFNNVYGLNYGVMNVVDGQPTDTVNNYVIKSDDVSETAQALIRLNVLTGNASYLAQADALLANIDLYMLDPTNGGYYSSMNLQTGVVNVAYKETRATAHMVEAYNWRNTAVGATTNTNIAKELGAIETLTNPAKFYKTPGDTGYFYRVKGDSTFGTMTDNYTPAYSSTLAHAIAIGDSSVQTNDPMTVKSTTNGNTSIPSPGTYVVVPDSMVNITVSSVLQIQDANPESVTVTAVTTTTFTATFANVHTVVPYTIGAPLQDTCMIINYTAGDEEEITLHAQATTGSGPYIIPVNSSANAGTGKFQKAHSIGEPIQSMLYPITLVESQYTTEAMGNVCSYLLRTIVYPIPPPPPPPPIPPTEIVSLTMKARDGQGTSTKTRDGILVMKGRGG